MTQIGNSLGGHPLLILDYVIQNRKFLEGLILSLATKVQPEANQKPIKNA